MSIGPNRRAFMEGLGVSVAWPRQCGKIAVPPSLLARADKVIQ